MYIIALSDNEVSKIDFQRERRDHHHLKQIDFILY